MVCAREYSLVFEEFQIAANLDNSILVLRPEFMISSWILILTAEV